MTAAYSESPRSRLWQMARSLLNRPLLIVALITLLAAGLRLYHLDAKSLNLDEAKHYWTSIRTLNEIVFDSYYDFHGPPLYMILLHLTGQISRSVFALRLLSAVMGIASVPLLYLLARRFVGRGAAYLCILMAAVSVSHVQYAQELREYMPAYLGSIVLLLCFQRFMSRPDNCNTALLMAALALGLLSQYGLLLLVGALNVIVGVMWLASLRGVIVQPPINRALILRWTAAQIFAAAVLLALYLLVLRNQLIAGGVGADNYLRDAYWNGSLVSLARLLILNTYQIIDFAFVYSSLFILLLALGLFTAWRLRTNTLLLALVIVPLVVTFIAALFKIYPYHGNRHAIFLTPMLFVAAAAGFDTLTRLQFSSVNSGRLRAAVGVIIAGALLLPAMFYTGLYLNGEGIENVRPLADTLRSEFDADGGDLLYVGCAADDALLYYYPDHQREWIMRGEDVAPDLSGLDEAAGGSERIWLIFSHCSYDELRLTLEHVSAQRRVQLVQQANGAWLYRTG